MRTRILVGVTCAILLCGCGKTSETPSKPKVPTEAEKLSAQAKQAAQHIAAELKDPDSARFRNVRRVPFMKQQPTLGHYAYCGEINGKNSFGAYSGFQPFAVVPPQAEKGQWFVELTDIENGIGFIWLTNCEEDGKPVEGQPVSFEE